MLYWQVAAEQKLAEKKYSQALKLFELSRVGFYMLTLTYHNIARLVLSFMTTRKRQMLVSADHVDI